MNSIGGEKYLKKNFDFNLLIVSCIRLYLESIFVH